jgi:hypothetical protein
VLTAQASGATAQITVDSFAALLNNLSVACTVAAPITGLTQDQLYYVYYIDPAFAGGALTPIATQNPADFTGKVGYYSLGSIQTPTVTSGVAVQRPSVAVDSGDNTTLNPACAYDANPTTYASVTAIKNLTAPNNTGICTFSGFPVFVLPSTGTLTISAAIVIPSGSTGAQVVLSASLDAGATWTTILTATSTAAHATYTMAVPISTNISNVLVSVESDPPSASGVPFHIIQARVFDINIQP